MITLYADGSCAPNPGIGGWGCVLMMGEHYKEICGCGTGTDTNNQMELMAVIKGLEEIKTKQIPIHVYTDSGYVVNIFTQWIKGWRKKKFKDVKNAELIQYLDTLVLSFVEVRFFWVKGHSTNQFNIRADELANTGREQYVE